jgi:hypothetical protein
MAERHCGRSHNQFLRAVSGETRAVIRMPTGLKTWLARFASGLMALILVWKEWLLKAER